VVDLHTDASVLELFAVRRICEGAAAAMAAARITAPQIEDLRRRVASVDASTDVEQLVRHDLGFHGAVTEAAGNSYLTALVESLSSSTVRARVWRGLTQENAVARTLDEHRALVDALEIGDAKLAESLAITHISGVEQWLRSRLQVGETPTL
jgi:GntR family transcriptional repressor for pyruvate dehydrogenase complex